MLPSPLNSVKHIALTLMGVCLAALAIFFAAKSYLVQRNAQLVEIGVSILKVDPKKEAQLRSAREWALELIESNAGGVKFSADARARLLDKQQPVASLADGKAGGGPRARAQLMR
jgi:hypothetical protein